MQLLKKIMNSSIQPLIWISVILYFVELSTGSENGRSGWLGFLWIERFIACFFTIEYLVRLHKDKTKYAISALGIIDLIAIIPFWIGFFIPVSMLPLIRTLRILRLLKLFRYNRSLQLIALAYYKSFHQLRFIAFATLVVGLFCLAGIYEVEHKAQPDVYDGFFNTFWYFVVTITTVGYGDMFPITVIGKSLAMMLLFIGIMTFSGIVGIVGTSLNDVLNDEINPDIDPIKMFKEEKERQKEIKKIDSNWQDDQETKV